MSISFRQANNIDGSLDSSKIIYIDDNGQEWWITLGTGSRYEDIYNDWLAAGNTPLPPTN
jgi:hypothetical protein